MPAKKRTSKQGKAQPVPEGSSRGFMRGTIIAQGDIVAADHDAWGLCNVVSFRHLRDHLADVWESVE